MNHGHGFPLLTLLVHAGMAHLIADLAGCLVVGWWLESRFGSWRMLVMFMAAGCCTELAHNVAYPEHGWQFGLSGVVYCLAGFGLVAVKPRARWQSVVLCLLAIRIGVECFVDGAMLTASIGGFSDLGGHDARITVFPVPAVHAIALIAGAMCGVISALCELTAGGSQECERDCGCAMRAV